MYTRGALVDMSQSLWDCWKTRAEVNGGLTENFAQVHSIQVWSSHSVITFYSYLTPIRFLSITVIRLIGPMKDPQLHKTKNETAPVLGINNALSIRQAPNPAQERTPSVV